MLWTEYDKRGKRFNLFFYIKSCKIFSYLNWNKNSCRCRANVIWNLDIRIQLFSFCFGVLIQEPLVLQHRWFVVPMFLFQIEVKLCRVRVSWFYNIELNQCELSVYACVSQDHTDLSRCFGLDVLSVLYNVDNFQLRENYRQVFNLSSIRLPHQYLIFKLVCLSNGTKSGVRHVCCDCMGSGSRVHYSQLLFLMQQQHVPCTTCKGQGEL